MHYEREGGREAVGVTHVELEGARPLFFAVILEGSAIIRSVRQNTLHIIGKV